MIRETVIDLISPLSESCEKVASEQKILRASTRDFMQHVRAAKEDNMKLKEKISLIDDFNKKLLSVDG